MLREAVSLRVRLLHYATAVILIYALIGNIPYTYKTVRYLGAGKAETYNAVELYTGGYVQFDYDFIRELNISLNDKTYCIAKLTGKDEYCLILYPGVSVMKGEYARGENYHGDSREQMEEENVELNTTLPGTFSGVVEIIDSEVWQKLDSAFEKLNGMGKYPAIVKNENIDVSRVVVFESPNYIYGNFFSRLILLVVCIPLFIVGCRAFSTQKRQFEERQLLKDDKEKRTAELLEKSFSKRRGRID